MAALAGSSGFSHFPSTPQSCSGTQLQLGILPLGKFFLLGILSPGNFSGVSSLPRKGSVGSAEAEGSWMNKQVLNLTLSAAFLILLIQTFLRGSNYTSSKLILSGCCGKDEALKMGVEVNIDMSRSAPALGPNVLENPCRGQEWKGRGRILLLWVLKNQAGGKTT